MEGCVLGHQVALEVRRDFAGSRLEEQILIRVFELVTPAIRRTLGENERSRIPESKLRDHAPLVEQAYSVLAKGA